MYIEIDNEVYKKLGELSIPFEESTPNMVLRRLLGLPKSSFPEIIPPSLEECIEILHNSTLHIHPAFLTFLIDKFYNSNGNFKVSEISVFMEKYHLRFVTGLFRNPWMKSVYKGKENGLASCQRTIEHFRQTRRFGCWNGKSSKVDCDAFDFCIYHPENSDIMKNKCDLRKGVIWKRSSPKSPYSYANNYINVIKTDILKNQKLPLEKLLAVFYYKHSIDVHLIEQFKNEFHLNNEEFNTLFEI